MQEHKKKPYLSVIFGWEEKIKCVVDRGESLLKYEKSCGAIVYKKEIKEIYILLVQMNRGHWSFPKGHMNLSETEEQTSLREVKEETNLEVDIIDGFRQKVSYLSSIDTVKEVIYFLAQPTSTLIQRQETEIKSISWFKDEKALDILSYDKDKEILKQALSRINSHNLSPFFLKRLKKQKKK